MLNNLLLPTSYLGPISYYKLLLQYNCTIEHHENFIKQSIRNRCEIYGANGKLILTVPKKRRNSSKTKISDIKISYEENWQRLHWTAIQSAYNSSPFFEYYKNKLKPFFKKKEPYLIKFNNKLQKIIFQILNEETNYKTSDQYNHTGSFVDLRNYSWKNKKQEKYNQVFMEKHGFIPNLSILDLIFNLGPASSEYLKKQEYKISLLTKY